MPAAPIILHATLRRLALAIAAAAAIATCGCDTLSSVKEQLTRELVDPFRDVITPGLPRMAKPLPEHAKVYIARPVGAASQGLYERNGMTLVTALEMEFRRHGAEVKVGARATADYDRTVAEAAAAGCEFLLMVDILRWEYGSAGWSGRGNRDEVQFATTLVNAARKRVLARHQVEVTNGVLRSRASGDDTENAVAPVIRRYVNGLYNP